MKHSIILPLLVVFTQSLFALSVTPSPSTLDCGTTTVTHTFDCTFTGSVLITNVPAGVTYPAPNIKTVTNGVLTFDLTLTESAPLNFSINFVVIGSDLQSCAAVNDSASSAFVSNCILPPNNDCINASVLTLETNSCTPVVFSTANATSSGSVPTCGGAGYIDLFYTFTANNDTVTLEIPTIPGTIGYYALLNGCSGFGTEIDCSIMIASLGSTYEFTNLTVDTDYYLQILFLPGNVGNDQELCLHSTTPPAGDPCPTTATVSDLGPDLPNQSYTTSQDIITTGSCNLTAAGIIFDATTDVTLGSGFDTGIYDFEAKIGGCTP